MTTSIPRDTNEGQLFYSVRWLTLLPSAALLSLTATALVLAGVNSLLTVIGYDADTFVSRAVIVAMRNTVLCSTFICAGVLLAPARKRMAVYVLAGVALAQAVIRLVPVLAAPVVDGWAV